MVYMTYTLGTMIKAGRERRGWNQAQLAQRIGVTGSFIGKLEKDETLPSYDRLIALASILGLEKQALLALSEQRKEERAQDRIRMRGLAARHAYGLNDAPDSEQESITDPNSTSRARPVRTFPGDDADPDVQRALTWLKIIFSDPALKNAALTTLESLALKAVA